MQGKVYRYTGKGKPRPVPVPDERWERVKEWSIAMTIAVPVAIVLWLLTLAWWAH